MDTKYHIGIERDSTSFKATVADLNLVVYGDTHQEAILNAQKAIVAAHIQTLEVMSDAELMAAFRQGVQELTEGKGRPWDNVKKDLGL